MQLYLLLICLSIWNKISQKRIQATEVTYICVLSAYTELGNIEMGESIHERILHYTIQKIMEKPQDPEKTPHKENFQTVILSDSRNFECNARFNSTVVSLIIQINHTSSFTYYFILFPDNSHKVF